MPRMIDFIVGLLGNLLAGELAAWGPRLADKIVFRAVKKFPPELEERMLEEWRALLADIPGDFSKVMTALSLFLRRQKIRDEFQVDHPNPSPSPTSSPSLPLLALTPRELSVLEWMKAGKTNWEISRILGVTELTIRLHIERIYLKLDVTSRTHAVRFLFERGCWKPSTNTHRHHFSYRPIWAALKHLLFTVQAVIVCRVKFRLNRQEFSVLLLMASGKTSIEIATVLGISDRAVRSHIENIVSKLPANFRLQDVSHAIN